MLAQVNSTDIIFPLAEIGPRRESLIVCVMCVSDKKVRDKAVIVLSKWFAQQSSLSDDDHLKIWKALYYCFWMSDKPAVQK